MKHTDLMGTDSERATLNSGAGDLVGARVSRMTRGKQQTKDVVGQRFGRLVVKRQVSSLNGQTRWLCDCDCGAELYRLGTHLRRAGVVHMCDACRKAGK